MTRQLCAACAYSGQFGNRFQSMSAGSRSEATSQREKIALQHKAAIARLEKTKVELQMTEEEVADRLARGEKIGNQVDAVQNRVIKAQSEIRIMELAVKRAKEREEEVLRMVRVQIEEDLRVGYAKAVRELDASLELASEKNQTVLDLINAAQRLLGQGQNIVHLLHWPELLNRDTKLSAWRDYIKREDLHGI